MSAHETVDVLVIGARAATAMLLARRGLDVLVVDRGEYGTDTLSTHALMRGAVLQLQRWGLLPLLEASDTPAIRRTAFHYGYWSDLDALCFHWHYRPGTSVGVIRTTAGETCVFAAMPPAWLRGAAGPALAALYHEVLADCAPGLEATLTEARRQSRLTAFAGRPGFLRRTYGPSWALVGDVGYFKDPITARGLTDALRDAELLAQAVATSTDAALAYYRTLRDAFSLPLLEVNDEIAALTDEQLQLAHSRLGITMREFALMADLLTETLEDFGLPRDDIAAVDQAFRQRETFIVARRD